LPGTAYCPVPRGRFRYGQTAGYVAGRRTVPLRADGRLLVGVADGFELEGGMVHIEVAEWAFKMCLLMAQTTADLGKLVLTTVSVPLRA